MKKEEFVIDNISCISYASENPSYLLIQPVDENDIEVLDRQVELLTSEVKESILMIAFRVKNWNSDLSPWEMPAIFGKENFSGAGKTTLKFIEETLIPNILEKYKLEADIKKILGGYSLAGLFSLWSAYQTDKFSSIVAASPSVWFKDWENYLKRENPVIDTIYLSLGDKEEKTRNKIMSSVGDVIRIQEEVLKNQGINTILEWNKGGHFQDSDIRLAKGFAWCIKNLK
ncbi:MAG: alpha/beta hydrolase-fold protein [Gemella sp.]|nr:alpha/beta hydrolase-fold protein [Gemella sp.]